MIGLFIVIPEISPIPIDSIPIDISRRTDSPTPTKKVIILSDGVDEVPSLSNDI
jgi:hypothetical protein